MIFTQMTDKNDENVSSKLKNVKQRLIDRNNTSGDRSSGHVYAFLWLFSRDPRRPNQSELRLSPFFGENDSSLAAGF